MQQVYIIIENGVSYPNAYFSYNLAVNAVKLKYTDWDENSINEIDVPENKSDGITELYIEKGIYITIYKLPIIFC